MAIDERQDGYSRKMMKIHWESCGSRTGRSLLLEARADDAPQFLSLIMCDMYIP